MTFRLDDVLLKRLRAESNNKQISTNTLVNQALRRFLDWGMYEPTGGFVLLHKHVFTHIFGKLTQKEIVDIASKIGKDEVKNMVLFMKGRIDMSAFLSWFELRMINSAVQVSCTRENNSYRYVMKHELGKNWSLYHKTVLELIFNEVFHKKINVMISKSMISFEISE